MGAEKKREIWSVAQEKKPNNNMGIPTTRDNQTWLTKENNIWWLIHCKSRESLPASSLCSKTLEFFFCLCHTCKLCTQYTSSFISFMVTFLNVINILIQSTKNWWHHRLCILNSNVFLSLSLSLFLCYVWNAALKAVLSNGKKYVGGFLFFWK